MARAYPAAGGGIPAPSPRCVACANCCVVFASAFRRRTGVVFLAFVGQLLARQPLYVAGVEHPATASTKCFGAAWAYAVIVLVSVATIAYDKCAPAPAARSGDYTDMGPDLGFLGADAVEERDRRRAARNRGLGGLELQPMAML